MIAQAMCKLHLELKSLGSCLIRGWLEIWKDVQRLESEIVAALWYSVLGEWSVYIT